MTADLGEHRGVYTRLLDDPKYRILSPPAMAVFWMLKLVLPRTGIGALYPVQLTPYCRSLTVDGVERALGELKAAGWIKREDPVVWLVNALKYELGLRDTDRKHRKYVQKLVGSLPGKNRLVAAFRTYYRDWFVVDEAKPLRRVFEGSSKGLRRPVDVDVDVHRGRSQPAKRSIAARASETNGAKRHATAGGRASRLRTE